MAIADLDPADVLDAAGSALRAQREAEVRVLELAVHWADLHPGVRHVCHEDRRGTEFPVRLGGEGTPEVMEFAPAELGVELELHPLGARSLIADGLDLRHRLPLLRRLVRSCRTPVWVARKVARITRPLDPAQVAAVDERIAGESEDAATLPPSRLLEVVEGMVVAHRAEERDRSRDAALGRRFVTVSSHQSEPGTTGVYGCMDDAGGRQLDDTIGRLATALADAGDEDPVEVRRAKALVLLATPALALRYLLGDQVTSEPDPARTGSDEQALARLLAQVPVEKLAPTVVLYLHLTDHTLFAGDGDAEGVARWEGVGAVTRQHLLDVLGHANVEVRPVFLPAEQRPRDSYEYDGPVREAMILTVPVDTFPYALAAARGLDVDHNRPYDPDGPPGQTCLGNGGPLTRHHHRIKTAGGFRVRQPRRGTYVWRTPHRRYRMTDRSGTHRLGRWLGDAVHGPSPMETACAGLLIDHGAR